MPNQPRPKRFAKSGLMARLYPSIKAFEVWYRRLPKRIWYRLRYPPRIARLLTLDSPRATDELLALYELGRQAGADGAIVEIGTFQGSSTIALALGTRAGNNVRIYSIDPY